MKFFDLKNDLLIIKWVEPQPAWGMTKEFVKTLAGRSFDPVKKEWKALASEDNIQALLKAGFIPSEAVKSRHKVDMVDKPIEKLSRPSKDVDMSKLNPNLHPYQVDGVKFLEGANGNGILAWSVGCGKSLGALSYCNLHDENFPALILCPSSIKTNWQREAMKWYKKPSIKLSGKKAYPIGKYPYVIINYDILGDYDDETSWTRYLSNYGFKTIILDECHMLKNSRAKRTKAFMKIAKNVKYKIFLSGTIIKNRTTDLYVPLHSLDPVHFPNEWKFLQRYCDPKFDGFGWTYKGLTHADELAALMNPLIYKIDKRDVLKDLPDRQINTVPMEVDQTAETKYQKASKAFKEWVRNTKEKKLVEKKAHFELLRALAFQMKHDSVIEWIRDFLESGEKLIVFAVHTKVIDELSDIFGELAVVVDGRTTGDRQLIVDKFTNDDNVKLFIGQIEAAGVGLNLQVASNVAIVELPYSIASITQAFGRVDRIDQKADKVCLWNLFAPGTIEEEVAVILEEKKEIVDTLLNDGKETDIFGMPIEDILLRKFGG